MNDEEYKRFLTYLFNEYIRDRIHRVNDIARDISYDKPPANWLNQWRTYRRVSQIVRYIHNHCDTADEVYKTFRLELLYKLVSDVKHGVWSTRILAHEAGFLDALDAHLEEIIAGLNAHHLPEQDLQALSELGSLDPSSDLRGIVYLLKARSKHRSKLAVEMSVSDQLARAEDPLSEIQSHFRIDDRGTEGTDAADREAPKVKHSPRWFKPLGHIVQGASLTLAWIPTGSLALTASDRQLHKVAVRVPKQLGDFNSDNSMPRF